MSDSRKTVSLRQYYLTQEQINFIIGEAKKRDPRTYAAPGGTRAQSGVVRDIVDFARAHEEAFHLWVAGR